MKRDLVFFVSGIVFGVAAGYFLFRTLAPTTASATRGDAARAGLPAPAASPIGLDAAQDRERLDEDEVQRLEARAEANPRDGGVRAEIGGLFMDAERFSEALPWLEEAARLEPSDLHVRNHLAISYLNLGRLDDAVATYEGSLEIDPRDPASLLGLGRIKLYIQQDIRGGLTMWETLVSVAPDSAEARAVRDELEALKSAHPG